MITTYELRRKLDSTRVIAAAHKVFQFPGGESHIVFEPTATTQVAFVKGASGDDLISLAMWADAVKRHGGLTSVALIPYLPAARQDRGVPLGAKVYADIINSMGIDQVVAVDPHSDVAPALYDRLLTIGLDKLPLENVMGNSYTGVIAPDIGARKRAEIVAARFNVPLFQATKHRDFATGKLSGFECEALPPRGKLLLVDDICDGGGTFVGLAEHLQSMQGISRQRLALWVTHGIFSNRAVDRLLDRYHLIGSTNSHLGGVGYELPTTGVRILSILDHMVDATGMSF